jgi:hypothetical protein
MKGYSQIRHQSFGTLPTATNIFFRMPLSESLQNGKEQEEQKEEQSEEAEGIRGDEASQNGRKGARSC